MLILLIFWPEEYIIEIKHLFKWLGQDRQLQSHIAYTQNIRKKTTETGGRRERGFISSTDAMFANVDAGYLRHDSHCVTRVWQAECHNSPTNNGVLTSITPYWTALWPALRRTEQPSDQHYAVLNSLLTSITPFWTPFDKPSAVLNAVSNPVWQTVQYSSPAFRTTFRKVQSGVRLIF